MSEARLRPEIWNDRDFTALSAGAQRMYMLLLSHPSRNWVGVLPLTIRRWAALAPDTTEDDIRSAVAELAAHRFVVVDWDTEELLIRTFIRNDKVYLQPQLRKSWMEQARQIASPALRFALHDELLILPDHTGVKMTRETAYALVERLTGSLDGSLAAASSAGSSAGSGVGGYVSTVGGSPSPAPSPTPAPTPAPARPARPAAGVDADRRTFDIATSERGLSQPVSRGASRLVEQVLPRGSFNDAIRTKLRIDASGLLAEGATDAQVIRCLELWLDNPKMSEHGLKNFYAQACKEELGPSLRSTGGTIDRSINDIMARANRLADLASKENHNGPRELEGHRPSPGQDQGF